MINRHEQLTQEVLRHHWNSLSPEERVEFFGKLCRGDDDDFFLSLKPNDQAQLLLGLPVPERRLWFRILAPDELAATMRFLPEKCHEEVLLLLDSKMRKEVKAILAYEEDEAGGLMNSRFARLRPDMLSGEALRYLRRQAQESLETMRYLYVLDSDQKLLGIVALRDLFLAQGNQLISDIMKIDFVSLHEKENDDVIKERFFATGLMAIPVLDHAGIMKGIVTIDDFVDVVQQHATEDIQKLGAVSALEFPYLETPFFKMIKKRAGWLTVLFIGEMFTATAMGYFETEIEKAVVLALFIPLIISSGGNSGSQASTLVVRALAVGDLKLKDWWIVLRREIFVGIALGVILGSIGMMRILVWPYRETLYGPHYVRVGITVALSLVGVVLWGSLSGSMLPFVLKKLRFDPATASAPFVATLVDVSGLVIYFTVASFILSGILL